MESVLETLPYIFRFYEFDVAHLQMDVFEMKCKICGSILAHGKDVFTSNLIKHITKTGKGKHDTAAIEYETFKSQHGSPAVRKAAKRKADSLSQASNKQIKIDEMVKAPSRICSIDTNLKLVSWIVKHSLPLSIVDSIDFKRLVDALNPIYKPPSSRTIKTRYLPDLTRQVQALLLGYINSIDQVNI